MGPGLGAEIARLRRARGARRAELAAACGISAARLGSIERGRERPDDQLLAALARALGLASPAAFFLSLAESPWRPLVDQGAPPAAGQPAAGAAAELAGLHEELRHLARQLLDLSRAAQPPAAEFRALFARLDEARAAAALAERLPLLRGLCDLHDQFRAAVRELEGSAAGEDAARLLAVLENILYQQGLAAGPEPAPGAPPPPGAEVLGLEPPPAPEQDGLVARPARPGYRLGEREVRPPGVVLWRSGAARPAGPRLPARRRRAGKA